MEDNDGILKIWASLPKDIQEALKKSAEESSAVTEEQFIAEIMIGECPQCESKVLFSLIQYFKNTTLFELSTSSTQYCSHCSRCIPLLSDNLSNIPCSNTQFKNSGSFSVYLGHYNLLRLIHQRLRH